MSDPGDSTLRILIADDDRVFGTSLAAHLQSLGHTARWVDSTPAALRAVEDEPVHIVLCDLNMPGQDGFVLLDKLRERYPEVVAIMVTGFGSIPEAVRAIRAGAFEFLSKPLVERELEMAIERAYRQHLILKENHDLRDRLENRRGLRSVIGHDHRMLEAMAMVEAVAPSKATAVIEGESGTGKSMIARAIHELSERGGEPYVELHCGSIPETLLESELFGHVRGAFTGAHADKQGRFLLADGGTIFIDEINSASPALQLKLLRVLQERTFEPVGSDETIEVDVRVLLASNEPLDDLVRVGRFREDLYYRVNVVKIELPPLRERTADIPVLAAHFLEQLCAEHQKRITRIDDAAMRALERYRYPGNVRELRNIIERAVVLGQRPTITVDDLQDHVAGRRSSLTIADGDEPADNAGTPWEPIPLAEALRDPERRIILKALRANDWNRTVTADQLEINRTTLYKKMKQLGIDKLAG